ncbi:MAG: pilus assembly protein TadG-related protein [Gemmataceae bacterium]
MYRHPSKRTRRGGVIPLLAISLIAMLTLVALAIDIGMLSLARTHAQNAADAAAMSAVRELNGDVATNHNFAAAGPTARTTATSNSVIDKPITSTNVTTDIGYYAYNSTLKRFEPNFTGTKPASEAWSAARVSINTTNKTLFARILGFNTMPVSTTATAVHRPRDVVLVMDFSGSMKFSSEPAYPSSGDITGSLNPDPVFPKFGHWSAASVQTAMQRTSIYVDSGGEAHAPNNLTMETENGPPMVNNFVTTNGTGNRVAAFSSAPADWSTQLNTTQTYVGDRAPRIRTSSTAPYSFTSGSYARTAWEFIQGSNPTYTANHVRSTITGPSGGRFDPDTPSAPTDTQGYGSSFVGYSMGPGYYGKTFYMWPPDPRFHPSANTAAPSATNPAKDTSGRWMADWRKRFFYNGGTTTPLNGDNSRLWSTTTKQWNQAGSTTYAVNYTAIIQWIKTGPQTLPSNLRAGRVLYYSAIPDTIPATGGTDDQRFWRAYIDYVIGSGSATDQKQTLYGRQPDSDTSFGTTRITARSSITGANTTSGDSDDPYMNYADNPVRPRLHFWFGPLTMLCFLGDNNSSTYSRNWLPGNCSESQCWQLKAGINSALADIQKNHPNDWVAMCYFSDLAGYTTPRVTLGKDYTRMKNALFFPFSLLDTMSNSSSEMRPYNTSFVDVAGGDIPNARGGTCPESGFMLAYNQLSSATGYNGRRGASKMVIFETDGVPNTQASGTYNAGTSGNSDSYYTSLGIGAYIANGDAGVISDAKAVVTQMCALNTAAKPGFATTRLPVRVHSIGFGDLFQTNASQKASALQFLLDVQKIGNTSAPSATSIDSYKIIVGDYNTRIENLRTALERIFQSGVQVTLIR